MDNIDLNFLKESEIEAIVSVIEKDFELKAAEKGRLCRLRKELIKNDQRAVDISQTALEGLCCVICFNRFVFLFNPKKICCSCSLQICKSCCSFVKIFNNYLCSICQQQKDLIAMNCSWFYENIRRKFMDGGSQIVANSLSEYPRKNLISPAILNMVKGTQITKFRYQVEDATRTIEESLIKVELSFTDKESKSIKYTELIQKFVEKLKQILRNTSLVLYITMENYLNKIGKKNNNIDLEVLNTLHEEVELLMGRKIDIKLSQRQLLTKTKTLEDLDSSISLETILSSPIVDKLLFDVQQSLMESRGKEYDDLNSTLKSMVKKTKYDFMDFDYESVSQAPSRQGTIRRNLNMPPPQKTLFEKSKSASIDSFHSSRLYDLSERGEKSNIISKQWNNLLSSQSPDVVDALSSPQETLPSQAVSAIIDDSMATDSDAVSMTAVNQTSESNWLMKARFPIDSLNSLFRDSTDPYIINRKKIRSLSIKSEMVKIEKSIDEETDELYLTNRSILSDKDNVDLDKVYSRNLSVVNFMQNPNNEITFIESGESQDSGIVTRVKSQPVDKPLVPSRKSKTISTSGPISNAPLIPKRKSYLNIKPSSQTKPYDSISDSSVEDERKKKKYFAVKGKTK